MINYRSILLAEISRRNLGFSLFLYYAKLLRQLFIKLFVAQKQYRKLGFRVCTVEIQSRCNRQCSFCYNNSSFPKRDQGQMNENIWRRIIDELADLNYCGRLSFDGNAEPLLDERLPVIIRHARNKCPYSMITIFTNGDFLDEALLVRLIMQGLDKVVITDYDHKKESFFKLLEKKYPLHVRYKDSLKKRKYNRPIRKLETNCFIDRACLQPSTKIVINWKGQVVLCCQDFYAQYCFGQIGSSSILDIWNSKDFVKYRNKLADGQRWTVELCKNCDKKGPVVLGQTLGSHLNN